MTDSENDGKSAQLLPNSGSPLTLGAEAKKLEPMRHVAEPVLSGDPRLEVGRDAIVNLEDLRTDPTHEVMVMMPAGLVLGDFETGTAIAEVDPLHQSELFESRQRAIDRGEIATFRGERPQDVLRRPGALVLAQDLEDLLS